MTNCGTPILFCGAKSFNVHTVRIAISFCAKTLNAKSAIFDSINVESFGIIIVCLVVPL